MRHYELVFVLKPTLTEEERKNLVETVKGWISNNDGEIYNFEEWGRKELAYPIQKFNSAYYYLVNYNTENPELPVVLERNLRLNEDIIRFLNFKIKPQKKESEEVAEAVEV